MPKLETVKIKDKGKTGFVVINKADFVEGKHESFKESRRSGGASKTGEANKGKGKD